MRATDMPPRIFLLLAMDCARVFRPLGCSSDDDESGSVVVGGGLTSMGEEQMGVRNLEEANHEDGPGVKVGRWGTRHDATISPSSIRSATSSQPPHPCTAVFWRSHGCSGCAGPDSRLPSGWRERGGVEEVTDAEGHSAAPLSSMPGTGLRLVSDVVGLDCGGGRLCSFAQETLAADGPSPWHFRPQRHASDVTGSPEKRLTANASDVPLHKVMIRWRARTSIQVRSMYGTGSQQPRRHPLSRRKSGTFGTRAYLVKDSLRQTNET